jgi:hypothetical protein
VGGGCRDSARSTAWKDATGAVPNDLIAAAEKALRSARRAGDEQARVIDIADLFSPQVASSQN